MQKKLYFGSNLKMYKNIHDTVEYLQDLVAYTKDISRDEIELFIIPSYTTLESATKNVDRTYVKLGAQNMCWEDEGQFTGEISPLKLIYNSALHRRDRRGKKLRHQRGSAPHAAQSRISRCTQNTDSEYLGRI